MSERQVKQCHDCGKDFSWDDYVWDYFMVPKYRSKSHTCECGASPSLHEPYEKSTIAFWNKLKEVFKEN